VCSQAIKEISASEFLDSLRNGSKKFECIRIVGDVDFGNMVLDELFMNHVSFQGEVSGTITTGKIFINGNSTYYHCHWQSLPVCYAGSLIRDLSK
jgi:hypothetical protein